MLTTPKPNFAEALRQADESLLSHGVPPEVQQRLQKRLAAPSERRAARRWLPATVAACAAALLLLSLRTSDHRDEPPSQALAAGFALDSPSEDLRYSANADGSLTVHAGECEVVSRELGIRMQNSGPVTVLGRDDGVRMVRGTARFSVDERQPAQAPARVWVSHGLIEVLGTEFTVHQREHGGDVALHEGAIRFVGERGQVRTLQPGDSLTWPVPDEGGPELDDAPEPSEAEAQPGPAAQAPAQKPKVRRARQTDAATARAEPAEADTPKTQARILDELAKLRSRGEYGEAAHMLRESLRAGGLSAVAREQLSYELGTILSDQLEDPVAACDHWNAHSRRQQAGRYAAEVEAVKRRLDCEGRR